MTDDPVTVTATSTGGRWLARLALAIIAAAAVVVIVGGLGSLGVVIAGALGMVLALVGLWEFLSRRGVIRWLGAFLAVAAPVAVLVIYTSHNVLWAVLVAIGLVVVAIWTARTALAHATPVTGMVELEATPPERAFLVMNPRSGGGKVGRFSLDTRAAELGAEVALMDGPGPVDVAALAQKAVEDGADLLGVAGGDGTQALVAGIAAEHDLPFLVISAGTRNHFAMDLGLNRDQPAEGLDALRDGVTLRLDLGKINGRTFVNNASFGAYAEIVQSDAYRDDKAGMTLQMLPDLLSGKVGPKLRVWIDGELAIENPKALLVSNNPYALDDLAGLGRRARLDGGVLGVIAVTVENAAQAVALVGGRHGKSLHRLTAHEVVIESDVSTIPVGVDGEALMMTTPVRCTLEAGALDVRVPRSRPGIPKPAVALDPSALLHQAFPASGTPVNGASGQRSESQRQRK
jgi:diacylglycerol kinase family enzyme